MEKLVSLAKLYPNDFDSWGLRNLSHELGLYISDVRDDDRFFNLSFPKKWWRLENMIVIPWFINF
jgi:hypothetical protein